MLDIMATFLFCLKRKNSTKKWHPQGIMRFLSRYTLHARAHPESAVTRIQEGVSNDLIEFKSARKIWPLLELLAKIR